MEMQYMIRMAWQTVLMDNWEKQNSEPIYQEIFQVAQR